MRRPAAIAGILVVLALGAWLRWTPAQRVADLRPRPDALEYEEAARSLADGEGYALRIGAAKYPPRYPPGFSVLLVPAVAGLGEQPGVGVLVVLVAALAAIAGTARLGALAAGLPGAVVAGLLIAISPLHVRWSRAVMSDVPCSAAVAWLAVWTLGALGRGARPREWLALGLAFGLAASLRGASLLLVPPALGLLLARRRALPCAALLLGVGLGGLPLLWSNALLYGSPLGGGYDYWAPGSYFGKSFLLGPVFGGQVGNAPFYLGMLAGAGRLYPWPIALLVGWGAVLLWRDGGGRRAIALLALGTTAAVLAVQMPFFWQGDRYLLPAVPLLCALGAAPFAAQRRPAARILGLALAIGGALLVARASQPFAPPDQAIDDARSLQEIDRLAEANAAVVVRTNPLFFARLARRGGDRVWVPIGLDEHRAVIRRLGRAPLGSVREGSDAWLREPILPPARTAAVVAAVEQVLAEGRPVYLVAEPTTDQPFVAIVQATLAQRFALERVAVVGSREIRRLREREALR